MLFDIIYDYFANLFLSSYLNGYSIEIMGQNTTLVKWLALSCTFIIMGLLITFMILVVRWCFRLTAGLFKGL